jgi:SagB-type dehydrogenase family enzyme
MTGDELAQARVVPSLEVPSAVYGEEGVREDDPAELFHEASKFYPSFAPRQTPGVMLVEDEGVQAAIARAVRRRGNAPIISLPQAELPTTGLGEAIRARRTRYESSPRPLELVQFSTLLQLGYGRTAERLRAAPSGGALYPLEIHAVVNAVDGLEPGLYHYDPFADGVRPLRDGSMRDEIAEATLYPEVAHGAGTVLLLSAVFWRTRFKYGLRGYRFALLEAGHVAQNMLLAAEAMGLAAAPIGGYYDRKVDELLELDGVNESTLYMLTFSNRGDDGA